MILVIGYGNPLRTDDAIGQHVAWELMKCFDRADLIVRITHQLTPELAEIVSHFDTVVFIDARVGDRPGEIIHEEVQPAVGAGAFTHNVTPAALLGAANELYDRMPVGLLISIVGEVFDYGIDLSPRLYRMLPGITRKAAELILKFTSNHTFQENTHARIRNC